MQSGCAFAKAAPSSISNGVDDNGDMEAGAYEAQEQDLHAQRNYPMYDEDDVTGTCHPATSPRQKAASVTTPTSNLLPPPKRR